MILTKIILEMPGNEILSTGCRIEMETPVRRCVRGWAGVVMDSLNRCQRMNNC